MSGNFQSILLYLHEGRNYATCKLASYVVSYEMPFLGMCKSHHIDLVPVQDSVHVSSICSSCNVVERPLIKPNCLIVNKVLILK